jgi:hypothetical protein
MFNKLSVRHILLLLISIIVSAIPFAFYSSAVYGTSVDRISLCNLEGYPGDTIEAKITLVGTDASTRSGFWDKYYRAIDGDNGRMDIRSWISFNPSEYTVTQGESKIFTVIVKIPERALAGLWGAASAEAGLTNHSGERRTYIIFKDAFEGGNLYSGMLIPVSVQVLGKANPLGAAFNILRENALVSGLVAVIIILLAIILTRLRSRKKA